MGVDSYNQRRMGKRDHYTCIFCSETFPKENVKLYRNHIISHRLAKYKYSCEYCNKEFSSTYPRERHKCSRQKSFFCKICGKGFVSKQSLQDHNNIHTGLRPFLCDICGKSFAQRGTLNTHKKFHALGYDPYAPKHECEFCGKKFDMDQRDTFETHVAKHKNNSRKHTCHICGKVMTSFAWYAAHVRTHFGEKPFGCDVCGKAFTAKKYLVTHRRIHTGEKPYACKHCGRSFSQKGSLNRHRATHMVKSEPHDPSAPLGNMPDEPVDITQDEDEPGDDIELEDPTDIELGGPVDIKPENHPV